jgi:AcrR family transcriptional regulator
MKILRKSPSQSRSHKTVDFILKAVAQVLEQGGESALTTTSVAERAGVSIGTLYQYFSDRDALLVAFANQEHVRIARRMRKLLSGLDAAGADPPRQFVRVVIRSFANRRGATRLFALMTQLKTADGRLQDDVADILAAHWSQHADAALAARHRTYAYVLTRALVGVLKSAALENPALFKEQDLEDALCLIVGALRPSIKSG